MNQIINNRQKKMKNRNKMKNKLKSKIMNN